MDTITIILIAGIVLINSIILLVPLIIIFSVIGDIRREKRERRVLK